MHLLGSAGVYFTAEGPTWPPEAPVRSGGGIALDRVLPDEPAERSSTIDPMQNDPLSHGLWEMTAPPAPPTSPLKGEVRADVAIVGCGYTGLSTALQLAEAGAKVVALEAVEIGFGGAGRNVGLVNAGMWLAPDEIVGEARPGLWRTAARSCSAAARRRSTP